MMQGSGGRVDNVKGRSGFVLCSGSLDGPKVAGALRPFLVNSLIGMARLVGSFSGLSMGSLSRGFLSRDWPAFSSRL